LLKDVRGEVLRFGSILNAARDIGIDGVKIPLIELRKAARILLSSLYSHAFVRFSNPTQVILAPVFY
jgi:hypothetical protein